MSNDLTPLPGQPPARKRLELPTFPVHTFNPDGSLIPLTPAQWRTVPTNIARLDVARAICHEEMFALADLMANEREPFGENDKGFGQYLKKFNVEVERNELSIMTTWWRKRTQAQRIEAMNYAITNGINRMVTLKRHFDKLEPSPRRTIDVQASVVATKAIDAPEPTPMLTFAQNALAQYPAPKGVHAGDLNKVLNMIGQTDRTWRLAKALVRYVEAHPKLIARLPDIE